MKKLRIIFMFLFINLLGTIGLAQFQIGPLIGGNLNGLSSSNSDDIIGFKGYNINNQTGFAAGGIIVINFSPMFGLQLEPTYMQRGAVIYTPYTDVGLILEIEQTIEVNYIDIPALFRVSFGGEYIKPYLLAGAYIAFPLENGKNTLDKLIGNGQDLIELVPSDEIEQELTTTSIDYGLNFGAGFSFPLGIINFFIEAQYSLAFTNFNEEEFIIFPDITVSEIKNKGIQLKTGFLFSL